MSTPRFGLTTVPTNTTNPSVPVNDALLVLDAMIDTATQSKTLTAPPATVAGDRGKVWIPAATATGAWAGKEKQLAICTGADAWQFVSPPTGKRVYNIADTTSYLYNGSAWV